ncbi:alpha/beta fold hydrolase [Pantoea sp. 1.19]|uniref:alpha/beta fold hydrolase n=1 Tax=Pantoea sp. 1.19 TaxID=1925589 RepID=UPI000948EAF5|nr:alpha/beta hydrolase [Pantoea sp. 1.19]
MVYWREAGSGEPVVLLHGISSGSRSWHKQLNSALLQQRFRLLAWDAPGYGESSALDGDASQAESWAAALLTLFDRAGLAGATLVGHSLGAIVASCFAARYPARVSRLLLVDPAQGYGGQSAGRREQVRQQRTAQRAAGFPRMAELRAAHLLRPGASVEDIATVTASMLALRDEGYRDATALLINEDIHRWLSACPQPGAVWCGAMDTITPPAQCQRLAQRWGRNFHRLPHAGHACYLDRPADFNQRLLTLHQGRENGSQD